MATERLAPDVLVTQTGLTGTVAAIDDDPDSPDSNWLTTTNNTATTCRVSFPTPTGPPNVGAGLQEIRVQVRKTNHSTNPTVVVTLHEDGGASLATLVSSTTVSSTTGVVLSGTFNANLLGTADGSAVQVQVQGTVGSGNPGNRASVEVGAVEWNVDYALAAQNYTPALINQTAATFAPTVTTGAVTYTPALIDQTAATFTPTISQAGPLQTIFLSPIATSFDSYDRIVLADQPVGYWRMGTSILDLVGGNDLGGPFGSVTYAPGPLGDGSDTATEFDGSTGYMSIADADNQSIVTTGELTIECWVYPDGAVNASYIVAKGDGSPHYEWGLSRDGTTEFRLQVWEEDGASALSFATTGGHPDGAWYHIVATIDDQSTCRIYINGVENATNSSWAWSPSNISSPVNIGRRPDATGYFDGAVDELAIYDYVLPPADVAAHYAAGVGADNDYEAAVIRDHPVLFVPMDEASGNITDIIGGKTGTANGTPGYGVAGPIAGKTGIEFDAVADYFDFADHADLDLGDGPFSIEYWFASDTDPGNIFQVVLGKGNNAYSAAIGADGGSWANRHYLGKVGVAILAGVGTAENFDGTWKHIVLTKEAGTASDRIRAYLNGVSDNFTENTTETLSDTTDALRIGQEGGSYPVMGALAYIAIYNYALTPEQVAEHYAIGVGETIEAGYQIFAPTVTAPVGAQNYTPALIDQTAATFTPTVTAGAVTYAPALINQAAVAHQPTVTATRNLTVGLLNNAAATFTPTVTATRNLTIALLSQTAATFTPTVTSLATYAPALINQTATLHNPTISVGAAPVSVGIISQPAAPFTPTITTGAVSVAPNFLDQTAATFNPTVTTLNTYAPALINQAAVAHQPTVTSLATIAPNLITQTASGFAPTITTGAVDISLGRISQTASASEPTVTTGAVDISPALIDQTAVTFDPTVTSLATIDVALIDQTAAPHEPSIDTGAAGLSVGIIDQAAQTFTPTVTTGAVSVDLDLLDQSATTSTPTVTSLATISLALLDQTATASAPSVSTDISLALIDQTAVAHQPTVTAGAVNVSLALTDQTAEAFDPTVTAGAVFYTPDLIDQTAVAFAPAMVTLQIIELALTDQTAAAFDVTISTGGAIVEVDLISQTAVAHQPTITAGAVDVSPNFLDQSAATFNPTITTASVIVLGLIDQLATPFAPMISTGAATVTLGLIDQAAVAYEPTISTGGSVVELDLIAQTAQAFAPDVSLLTSFHSFTADAVLLVTQSNTFSTDALVNRTAVATLSLDSVILRVEAASYTLDAVQLKTATGEAPLDAVILATRTVGSTLDAVVLSAEQSSFSFDAVLRAVTPGAFTLDASLTPSATFGFSLDAVLQQVVEGQLDVAAVLRSTHTASSTLDATVRVTSAAILTLDAYIDVASGGQFVLNAYIFRPLGAILEPISAEMTADTIGHVLVASTIGATYPSHGLSWTIDDGSVVGAIAADTLGAT